MWFYIFAQQALTIITLTFVLCIYKVADRPIDTVAFIMVAGTDIITFVIFCICLKERIRYRMAYRDIPSPPD
jgi:hypothetical protein